MAKRPRIEWLTLDQIRAAAKESPRAAAECSKVHWEQILEAGPDEFRGARDEGLVSILSDNCALCERYMYYDEAGAVEAKSCLLKRNCFTCDDGGCCSEHDAARDAMNSSKSGKEWSAPTQTAIQALIDKIESKIK